MPKMMIECEDPNSFEAIQEAAFNSAGKCIVATYKHHVEMEKAGITKSKLGSAKKIAEESGDSVEAVRHRIRQGEKKVGIVRQKESKPQQNQAVVTKLTDSGGAREGAGRLKKSDCYCGVCGADFKDSVPLWHCNNCDQHLEMKVSECAFCHQDVRPDEPHTILENPETQEATDAMSNEPFKTCTVCGLHPVEKNVPKGSKTKPDIMCKGCRFKKEKGYNPLHERTWKQIIRQIDHLKLFVQKHGEYPSDIRDELNKDVAMSFRSFVNIMGDFKYE